MIMRIVVTSSLAQKHPQLFAILQEQHEMILCDSAKTLQETLNTQDFWNIALTYPEDIPPSNANFPGSLFCVVPRMDPNTLSLLKRSDVEDLILESEIDWLLFERIKKWERLHEKALAQFPLHDLIHDLKTPLAVIHSTLELLLLKKCQENSDVLFQKVKTCKSHLDRIKIMLANFVHVSQTFDLPAFICEENVTALIAQVLDSQISRLHMEGKTIKLEYNAIHFILDRIAFKQMIHNMVDHFLLFSVEKSSGEFLINKTKNKLHIDLYFSSKAYLPKDTCKKVFDKTGRIADPHLGIKYNKGFGLTYNLKTALSLGGNFLLEFPTNRDGSEKHVLRLQFSTTPVSTASQKNT
jgi:signal transduction histidine kinase